MWYNEVFISQNIKPKIRRKIIKKITKGKIIKDIYCLCITDKINFQLEILSTYEVTQEKERGTRLMIVGLAKGKQQALELTKDIILQIYNTTQYVNIKSYFAF